MFAPGILVTPRYNNAMVTLWKNPGPAWVEFKNAWGRPSDNPQTGNAFNRDVGLVIALSENEDDPYKLFVLFGDRLGWCMASELKPVEGHWHELG